MRGRHVDPEAKRLLDRRLSSGELSKQQYFDLMAVLGDGAEPVVSPPLESSASKESEKAGEGDLILKVDRNLSLYNGHLIFNGRKVAYEDIFSIGYTASMSSINFVPWSFSAWLCLIVQGQESVDVNCQNVFIPLPRLRRIKRAAAYLFEVTFSQRLRNYLWRMSNKGYVEFSDNPQTRLYADGKLTRGKLAIDLKDKAESKGLRFGREGLLESDPFEVGYKSGWFAPQKKMLDLTFDRDVIHSLLRNYAG